MTKANLLPGFAQSRMPDPPTGPKPDEDPREEPMRDPPIEPEHDDEVRQADGIEAPNSLPDSVVYDAEE